MMNFPIKLSDLASDFTLHLSYLHSALNNPALLLSQINKIASVNFKAVTNFCYNKMLLGLGAYISFTRRTELVEKFSYA